MTNPVVSLYEQIQLENAKQEWRFPVMPRWTHKPIDSGVRDPAEAYLLRTRKSRSTAVSALNTVVGLLGQEDIESTPWHLIGYCEMNVLRRMLAERYAPATTNKILSIVRGVLHQACELNLMSTDACERAVAVPAIPGPGLPAGRALEPGEGRALFQACAEAGPRAARDAALLAVLLGCGLRCSEAANLDRDHLDAAASALHVISKGKHRFLAHVNSGVATALDAWIEARGDTPGPLLCSINKGDRITLRRLSSEGIRQILKRRAEQAGIRSCTLQDLRRTFLTNGRPSRHRDIATTTPTSPAAAASTRAGS